MADDDKHEVKPEHLVEAIDLILWEAEQAKKGKADEDGKK